MNKYSGLKIEEVARQLALNGYNSVDIKTESFGKILLNQFKSPLIFLLIIAAAISFATKNILDGSIILIIICVNTALGFIQEFKARSALDKLKKFITSKIQVYRNDRLEVVDKKMLVPGDFILLKLGDVVPADCFVVEQEDLLVDESSLTGESALITKVINHEESDLKSTGILYSGSFIKKGEVVGKIFATGIKSKFGKISDLSFNTRKKTEYEKNLKNVSKTLLIVGGVYLVVILALNLILKSSNNLTELLLFVIAIAVTIIPEALPVIVNLTLSTNAFHLAKRGVIVKRLSAVEDLGNINILCTDKTGTLTTNQMKVAEYRTPNDTKLYKYCYLSSYNSDDPFDESIVEFLGEWKHTEQKDLPFDDIPFNPDLRYSERKFNDFKIKKGAPEYIFEDANYKSKKKALEEVKDFETKGYRAISFSVAEKSDKYKYIGTLFLIDEVKDGVKETVLNARKEGIDIKVITGDSVEVSTHVGKLVNIIDDNNQVIEAKDLAFDNPEELEDQVNKYSIFARADPIQKYKIIEALQKKNSVGYLGDGINDAPSLKLSSVGIVVDHASEIAKESADIILTRKELAVITDGIIHGRKAFENINKYIRHTLEGNFGNFFTVGILSVFLKFLPMLPIQILLTNLLTDISAVSLATDNVDRQEVKRPKHHSLKSLLIFSLVLGFVSSVFDLIFFGFNFNEAQHVLQTKWFIFSTLTEIAILFSARTKLPFYKASFPSDLLIGSTFVSFAILINLAVYGFDAFQITAIGVKDLAMLILLVAAYFIVSEAVKLLLVKFRKH